MQKISFLLWVGLGGFKDIDLLKKKAKRYSEDNTSTFMSVLLQNTSYKSVFSILLSELHSYDFTNYMNCTVVQINKYSALPSKKMHSETTTLYPLLIEIFNFYCRWLYKISTEISLMPLSEKNPNWQNQLIQTDYITIWHTTSLI